MKKINVNLLLFCLTMFLFSACEKQASEPENVYTHSAIARNYLDEVLGIMQNNSLKKYEIDWTEFRDKVLSEVDGAETIEDTYPGIEKAFGLLGDNHSTFVTPDGNGFTANIFTCSLENPTETNWPENIGYVKVDAFSGSANGEDAQTYAREIQDQIRSQDDSQISGWVVDLRGNLGGNMWPMLVGIGPVLGEGIAGYLIDADGNEASWEYNNGRALVNESEVITQINNRYLLINENPKVAVLLSSGIASSGEGIAISFVGRPDTKSFGGATCGLSTSNSRYTLSDGSTLYLTTTHFANRNKETYGFPVAPDTVIDEENVMDAAVEWLLE